MALDPTRRSPRMLAVLASFALLPLLAACNDEEGGDDDEDDDGMRAPIVMIAE